MPLFHFKVTPKWWPSMSDNKVSLLLALLVFLFVWFQARPVFFTGVCHEQAANGALKLLAKKSTITPDLMEARQQASMVRAGLYAQGDYTFLFEACLHSYGIR